MCQGTDSARKTSKLAGTMKLRSTSKEVEDELASMRGTADVDSVTYLERKPMRGVCTVEEERRPDAHCTAERRPDAHCTAHVDKDDITEVSSSRMSRDSSPAKSLPLTKRHDVKSASDNGIS